MSTQLSIDECKVMWVVGALERLATLGLLSSDIPLALTADAVDDYMEIDEYRNQLFPNDFEVTQIFKAIANSSNEREVEPEEMSDVIDLLLEYKNNRTEIVKYALSHQLI